MKVILRFKIYLLLNKMDYDESLFSVKATITWNINIKYDYYEYKYDKI